MKGFAGVIPMNPSKAFDSVNNELLIAKLEAYDFSRAARKLVYDYITNKKQRVKINGSISSCHKSTRGAPQGSVLGPLIFNIFINSLFFLLEEIEICSYADDMTVCEYGNELEHIISSLETCSEALKVVS